MRGVQCIMVRTYIIITICLTSLLTGCSHISSPEVSLNRKTAVGLIPTEITWNHKKYAVTGENVSNSIGKQLGKSDYNKQIGQRVIYQIKGKDSSKEIAIGQLSNTYFRAVAER